MENKNDRRKEGEEINNILNSRSAEKENDNKSTPIANGIIIVEIVIFIIMCILEERDLIGIYIFNIVKWGLIILGISIGVHIYKKKDSANKKYKEKVMPAIIEDIMGECFYDLKKFIDIELYYESGLFKERDRTDYMGSDYIEYKTGEINTVASKLKVKYTIGNGKTRSVHTQFLGEYFVNIFEKYDENIKLIIEYRKKISKEELNIPLMLSVGAFLLFLGIIGWIIILVYFILKKYKYISSSKPDNRYGKEFGDLFIVQGSDSIADKILTSDVTNILIDFDKYSGVETSISIKNNIMYIAFNTKSDLFNAGVFENNKEKYAKDYELMKEIRKVNDTIADKVLKVLE